MKGEVIKCMICGKEKISQTNGITPKYCSIHCRNIFHYNKRGGKEYQRAYIDKIRENDGKQKIKCEVCGKHFRQVGTHVIQAHGYETARQYREDYGFDVKKGQLPDDYKQLKSDLAFETGAVNNLEAGKKFWFVKGDNRAGRYKRSQQTQLRLKKLHTKK